MSVIWEYVKEIFEINHSALKTEETLLQFPFGKMSVTFDVSGKYLNNEQIGIELHYTGVNGYSVHRTLHLPSRLVNPRSTDNTRELKSRLKTLKNKISQIEKTDDRYAVSLGKIGNRLGEQNGN